VQCFDGDDAALKAKYWSKLWDHINGLPLYDGRYLIIASKNAPPSSREGGGNFYRELRNGCPAGVAFVAALPDDDGTDTYPFSLQYLAVCMSRSSNCSRSQLVIWTRRLEDSGHVLQFLQGL
jgi:hypothetical protein